MANKSMFGSATMNAIDLDAFLNEYYEWKKNIHKMHNENIALKEDIQHYKKQLKFAEENGKHNLKEITQLSAIVNSLQETIKKISEFEDENKALKKQLKVISTEKESAAQAYSEAEKRLHRKLEELARKNILEIDDLKTEAEENRKRDIELHKQALKAKDAEIQRLKEVHILQMKERNDTIARLELQYEGRITKLKEQTTRLNKLSRSAHAPNIQEIFRQKQQYIQKTYEATISALREEIKLYKSEPPLEKSKDKIATVGVQTDVNPENELLKTKESAHSWYSSLKKSNNTTLNSQRCNKKRKLFQPDQSYL